MKKFVIAVIIFLLVAVSLIAADGSSNSNLYTTVKQGGPLMIALMILAIVVLTVIVERIIFFFRNGAWSNQRVICILEEGMASVDSEYREEYEESMRSNLVIYNNSLEKGLALISGIGNIAPIIGFLGTVLGMINAFGAIAAATTVNAKVVAVGIQIALVTTAGGLLVAAPALTAYYFFVHVIQLRQNAAEEFIADKLKSKRSISSLLEA
ncbi:MAG: MotA/TolQ/ExbB proton channel family protein [Spirochaetes bacterium]|nr:MotA/TolQ/ExbB proton channel family protein [Spirochaetota bacterium]